MRTWCKFLVTAVNVCLKQYGERGKVSGSRLLANHPAAVWQDAEVRTSFEYTTYTCAFEPGCLMSHNWLHTPDYKV